MEVAYVQVGCRPDLRDCAAPAQGESSAARHSPPLAGLLLLLLLLAFGAQRQPVCLAAESTPPVATAQPWPAAQLQGPPSTGVLASGQRTPGYFKLSTDTTGQGRLYYSISLLTENPAPTLCEEGLIDVIEVQRELVNLFGDNPEGEPQAMQQLGGIYLCLGRYEEALAQFTAALTASQSIGGPAVQAAILHNIGVVYERQADHDAALEPLEAALALWKQVSRPAGEATTLALIGLVHEESGRHEDALREYQDALALWQALNEPTGQGQMLYSIGAVYQALGRTKEAEQSYLQALPFLQKEGSWTVLGSLGDLYYASRRYDEALQSYDEALAIVIALEDRPREAALHNNMGLAHYRLGQTDLARSELESALALVRDLGDRLGEEIILDNLGLLDLAEGQAEAAADHFEAALTIGRQVGDSAGQALASGYLGWVRESLGQSDEAVAVYRESIEAAEAIRGQLGVEPYKRSFAEGYAWIYQHLVRLLCSEGNASEAFAFSERARARSFIDSLGQGLPDLRQAAASELLRKEAALRDELAAIERRLLLEQTKSAPQQSQSTIEQAQAQVEAGQQEYEALLAQLQLADPELASLVTVPTTTVTEIQALLNDQTTLLSYYLTDQSAVAFLLTRTSFQAVALGATPERIRRAALDSRNVGLINLGNPYPRSLRDLYDWLVEPLLPDLNTPRIGIIPHFELHYVPFAGLTDGAGYFGERFTLFSLPSASVLPFLRGKTGRSSAAPLVLGDPETGNPLLSRLAYSAQEAQQVAGLFGTAPLLGSQASETALRQQIGKAGIVHLAAHGAFNSAAPLFSRLWLAPSQGEDGQLNAYEVYGLDLAQAGLVVLSACDTQMGELSTGDEVVGLNRAFLYGAPTVVASLWEVDDEATGALMVRFYTHLRAGIGKAEALRAAQEEMRRDPAHPAWAHPFYWAAFVLSGDPGEAPSVPDATVAPQSGASGAPGKRATAAWWAVGAAVAVLLAAGLGLWLRRRSHLRTR